MGGMGMVLYGVAYGLERAGMERLQAEWIGAYVMIAVAVHPATIPG